MGRKTFTYDVNTRLAIPQGFRDSQRQLGEELGGVIFGCTNDTFDECVQGRIFGLPRAHILYVQDIVPGLPLFLYNYSKRRLHGVYRAVSPGLPEINPHGWTGGNTAPTHFPAQVRVELCKGCDPLTEKEFKPVLSKNYQDEKHFVFELDKKQVAGLCKLFNCPVPTGPPREKWTGKDGLTVGVSRGTVGTSSGGALPRNANASGRPTPSQPTPANWKAPARKSEGVVLNMDEFPALGGGLPPARQATPKESIVVKKVVLNGGGGSSKAKGKTTSTTMVPANRRASGKGKVEAVEGGLGKKTREIIVSATSSPEKKGGKLGENRQPLGGKSGEQDPLIEVSVAQPDLAGGDAWKIVDSKKSSSKGGDKKKKNKTESRGGAGGPAAAAGLEKAKKGARGGSTKSVISSEGSVTSGQLLTPQRVEFGGELDGMGQVPPELEENSWKKVGKLKRQGGGERGGKQQSEKDENKSNGKKSKPRSKEFLNLETGVRGHISRDSWEGHINQLETERLRQPERVSPDPKPLGENLRVGDGEPPSNVTNMGLPLQQTGRKSTGSSGKHPMGTGVSAPKFDRVGDADAARAPQGQPLSLPMKRETILSCESVISSPRHSEMSMMVTVERRGAGGVRNPHMSDMGVSSRGSTAAMPGFVPRPPSDCMSDVEMASARGGPSGRHQAMGSLCGLSVYEEDEEMLEEMETCTDIDVQVQQPEQGVPEAMGTRQGSNPGGDIGVQSTGAERVRLTGYSASMGGVENKPQEDVSNLGVLGVLLSTANRRPASPPPQAHTMQSIAPQPSNEGVGKTSMSSTSERYDGSPVPLSVPCITEALYVIGGLDHGYIPTVETFDSGSCQWTSRSMLPSGKFVCGDITSLREFIFLVGGDPEVNTGHIYNTRTGGWSSMAPLSRTGANLGVGCTTCDGRVYAIGGGVPKNELSSVGVYDPNTDRWFDGPEMGCRRFAVGVASEFAVIYACGGFDGQRYLDSVEMLDTREGKWHLLPNMNLPRSSMACVMYNNCLWVIGGDSVDNTMLDAVEVFDCQRGSWHKMAAVNETRGYCTAEVLDGELYVIGGRKSRNDFALAGMERYNKSRSFWEKGYGAGESGARCFHSSCIVRC